MPSSPPEAIAAPPPTDTGARVAAMLDRWTAEDVSDEPDWDIEGIARLSTDASTQAERT